MIQHGSGNFEVLLENGKDPDHPKTIMTGVIQVPYDKVEITVDQNHMQKMKVRLTGDEFYKKLENVGYRLEEGFRLVQEVEHNDTGLRQKFWIWSHKNWLFGYCTNLEKWIRVSLIQPIFF